jgi:pimeloyl-ACP methyl ester carboxylesterase
VANLKSTVYIVQQKIFPQMGIIAELFLQLGFAIEYLLRSENKAYFYLLIWGFFEASLFIHVLRKYQFSIPGIVKLPPFTEDDLQCLIYEIKTPSSTPDPIKFIEGWFFGKPVREIGRADFKTWISDMLYKLPFRRLSNRQTIVVQNLIAEMEDYLDFEFGDHPPSPMITLSTNVNIFHRSILFYGLSNSVSYGTRVLLNALGFQRRDGNHLVTYHRFGTSKEAPIIFFHGLGMGIGTYVRFITELVRAYPTRTFLFPEMPVIAMRLRMTPCFPEQFVDSLVEACAELLISDAIFIGHSYGTIMLRWVDMFCPQLVRKRIFVDPICFRLWTHHIASNFFHKDPDSAMAYVVKYVATGEPGIALYMRDYFVWYQNTYWTKYLPENATIFFAEKDHIVEMNNVVPYMERYPCDSRKIRIVKDAFHGKMLVIGNIQPIFDEIDTKFL